MDETTASTPPSQANKTLQSGDMVIDLRALICSAGMFVGMITLPLAAWFGQFSWGYWAIAVLIGGAIGYFLSRSLDHFIIPSPTGHTMVTKVGKKSLGIAIRVSLSGGFVMAMLVALVSLLNNDIASASIVFIVGLIVAVGVGSLAALL